MHRTTVATRYAGCQYAGSLAVPYEILRDFDFPLAKSVCYPGFPVNICCPVRDPLDLGNTAYRVMTIVVNNGMALG